MSCSGSLSAQLMEAERVAVASERDSKQAELLITHLKQEIRQKQKEVLGQITILV